MITIIKSDGKKLKLPNKSILYLEASSNYTIVHTKNNEKYIVSKSLKYCIDSLPNNFCVRIHRSLAIPKIHISLLDETKRLCILTTGINLPISRRMLVSLKYAS